jgi:hypothetical protein
MTKSCYDPSKATGLGNTLTEASASNSAICAEAINEI